MYHFLKVKTQGSNKMKNCMVISKITVAAHLGKCMDKSNSQEEKKEVSTSVFHNHVTSQSTEEHFSPGR